MRITPKSGVMWAYINEQSISRDELARRIGVDRVTAYRVDAGHVEPSPKFIAGLIVVTGKPFEDLFDIVEDGAA